MWISELATTVGLPVPTVKFYLREGLLPTGTPTGATRADYDEHHVRRLRLIRALTEVARLRLDGVRAVLDAMDDESLPWHEAIGSAHRRLGAVSGTPSPAASERVEGLVRDRGWTVHEGSVQRAALAHALDALDSLDHPASDELLHTYADAAEAIAAKEVAGVHGEDRVSATEHVVVSTLLLEPVLLNLRRMAQENASAKSVDRRHREPAS